MPVSYGQQNKTDKSGVRLKCIVSKQGAMCRMDKGIRGYIARNEVI